MMEKLLLSKIKTVTHRVWLNNVNDQDVYRLIVSVSGYEARSIYWTMKTIDSLSPKERTDYLVVGFEQHRDELSRIKNDKIYEKRCLPVTQLFADEWIYFSQIIQIAVEKISHKAGEKPIEVHIDYSSMPRRWYCSLPFFLEKALRKRDLVYFWYTPGHYVGTEYPTAGVEDFHVFSGKPSLSPKFRTHIFGLGFDRIRSQAIWSVLDPENLVCFYSEPGTEEGYVKKVKLDNRDIISASKNCFSVPMHDFVFTYSKVVGIVREYKNLGDVILIPDGPKPLILASSLIPSFLGALGIVCFHVSKRKSHQYEPVDVTPTGGDPYGFSFSGARR